MELGADAVLVNTALADARDAGAMARAFAMAVEAGRMAWRAGLGPERGSAEASSPLTGFLFENGGNTSRRGEDTSRHD
jgi:thiazole synthase